MVHFGRTLRERRVERWENYYLGYKQMKKRIKMYTQLSPTTSDDNRDMMLKEFSDILDYQVEKIVLFLLAQEGQLASRLIELREEREDIMSTGRRSASKTAMAVERQESMERVRDIIEHHEALEGVPDVLIEYKKVGQDLLALLEFVEMNAVALRKILKKFDKQLGYQLTNRYIYTRSNHPYSQLLHVFRHVGIGAMVGTISRNLAELRARRLTPMSVSLYDADGQTWLPSIIKNEPIIRAIEEAEERLMQSTGFLKFLAGGSLIYPEVVAEEVIVVHEEDVLSLSLNLFNTFLYMVNYYIVLPTADKYAIELGANSTLCGVIIGSMALASLFSSVVYSSWSNRSYFNPLVLSTIILVMGNLMYAVALDFNSVWLVLIGRLLCGLGGARAINRRYIADCVPMKQRTAASAAFVSASALGMAVGPAISGLLQMDVKFLNRWTFNFVTAPGWVMCVCWLIYFFVLWFGFKEPQRANFNKQDLTSASRTDGDGDGVNNSCKSVLVLGGGRGGRGEKMGVGRRGEEEEEAGGSVAVKIVENSSFGFNGAGTAADSGRNFVDEENERNVMTSSASILRWHDDGVEEGAKRVSGSTRGNGIDPYSKYSFEYGKKSELEEPLLKGGEAAAAAAAEEEERGEREKGRREMDTCANNAVVDSKADSEDTESEDGDDGLGFWAAMAELTVPVQVNLFIYFVLKFAAEILLSESSVVTAFYFGWDTDNVALFLSLLGITVLPINFIVGSYISNVFEDRYIMLWSEIIMAIGIVLTISFEPIISIPYSSAQYVMGAMVVFVSCQVLEGVNLSLMSKVMSEKLSRGTYNCGLLSTEAGTSARVLSDMLISLAGYQGMGMTSLLNTTMAITLLLAIAGIRMTLKVFHSLF